MSVHIRGSQTLYSVLTELMIRCTWEVHGKVPQPAHLLSIQLSSKVRIVVKPRGQGLRMRTSFKMSSVYNYYLAEAFW